MELADVPDSKSGGGDTVPVRPRSPAPTFKSPQTLNTTGFAGFLRLPAYNSHTNESGNKAVFDCFFGGMPDPYGGSL